MAADPEESEELPGQVPNREEEVQHRYQDQQPEQKLQVPLGVSPHQQKLPPQEQEKFPPREQKKFPQQ